MDNYAKRHSNDGFREGKKKSFSFTKLTPKMNEQNEQCAWYIRTIDNYWASEVLYGIRTDSLVTVLC